MDESMDPRHLGFFAITGITFIAFASSFSVCFFNLATVDQCVAVANHWVEVFRQMGDHMIQWAIAFCRAAFKQ
jgi:hypothetical protein